MNDSKFLTLAEAAERLRMAPKTLQRWCADGKLKGARKVGRRYLVPVIEIERVLGLDAPTAVTTGGAS